MHAVELEHLSKSFGSVQAVKDLSLAVPEGSIYGFIGPNGAGKTTTIRMIMNIFYPDAGTIRIYGDELESATTDFIGYLPEERGLYKKMKVRDLLLFYGSLKSNRDVSENVDFWLDRLELSDWGHQKVDALSKGMSQKVQFIATVVSRPRLLILDEPFTGLDPVNTDVIRQAILGLKNEGTTIIFSTHDMSMAEQMCDYIFMIHKGRKVLDGTLAEIQESYGTDTIRIQTENSGSRLRDVEGVDKVTDFGQMQELRMNPDGDPQRILATILSQTAVKRFEITKPSLHDIFVRIAGREVMQAPHE